MFHLKGHFSVEKDDEPLYIDPKCFITRKCLHFYFKKASGRLICDKLTLTGLSNVALQRLKGVNRIKLTITGLSKVCVTV